MFTLLTFGLVSNILGTANIGVETIGAIWKKRQQEAMLSMINWKGC